MCGRFSLTATPDDVKALFGYIDQPNFPARYNIAPTQPIGIVRREHGQRRFALVRWGLVPGWVKDPASFTLLINARAESAAQKPSFKVSMRHHRCIVPASGFYEWCRTPDGKQPFWISPVEGGVIAMAGLWSTWSDADGGEIDTGALLTVDANDMMAPIHHRMPAILHWQDFETWLNVTDVPVKEAVNLLRPIENDYLQAVPVSSKVNKVTNDDKSLQEACEEQPASPQSKKQTAKPKGGRDQLDLF
ncbi:putative SOS response-associated peptidase YedK [Roseibium hamelinense]|uniref:Abasic site processing protein n=1 Tax=Roseibium hamelinense TaxID=150831 RepID=A0A562T268_9HYPH|nr:SOS response-associated peptidase [Roseibium hamelinense]MTI42277.1 SOS response-associated peptidase [Roseibium hamelinense]TWI87702.1 putative SOS response-associated peptidase YedK [Roseibium hamelinense]